MSEEAEAAAGEGLAEGEQEDVDDEEAIAGLEAPGCSGENSRFEAGSRSESSNEEMEEDEEEEEEEVEEAAAAALGGGSTDPFGGFGMEEGEDEDEVKQEAVRLRGSTGAPLGEADTMG